MSGDVYVPAPCAWPAVIIAVPETFFRPARMIACQHSIREPWKAKTVLCCCLSAWNFSSFSGVAAFIRY